MLRILVCGSHKIQCRKIVFKVLNHFLILDDPECLEIVEGEAAGPDTHAREWAELHEIKVTPFHADWKRLGKYAGKVRNGLMAEYCEPGDVCLAFWDMCSPGTEDMIEKARAKGLIIQIVNIA